MAAKKLGFVGLGLIGGSIVRAIKAKHPDYHITAFSRSQAPLLQAKEEGIALKEEYETKLREIDREAEAILSETRKKALKKEEQILSEAKEEAARIIERANNEAVLERKRAMDEVKTEMIQIASIMAGKVVAANINTAVSDALVEETLNGIGDSTWLS